MQWGTKEGSECDTLQKEVELPRLRLPQREREKTTEEDLSHRIRELQMEEKEEPNKVAIFAGTVTSEGLHLDLNEGAIHVTFSPDTVAEPTDIMVFRWKYGICLPQLEEHEAIVSNVIEISAEAEVGGLTFNSEVKLVLSHSAAELEGYELVMKRLTDTEKNEWQEISGCEDIRQVSDTDDYPCPNNVPYSFPVVIASITKCSTYAVVSRLKSSPAYNITVSGGTFVHPGYPQVTITAPQEAVETETRLSLQLKVQEVPQNEFQGHSLFYGPILHVLCSSRATFLQPVTIQLPISLGNKPVNIPEHSECRVRIFFLSPEREPKEWVEISDKLEAPASYDGKLVKFKVQRFSGYFCLLDWTTVGSGVAAIAIIDYLSGFTSNPPLVANFFAYFDPKERQGSHDILFLICSPAHRSKDVKQELEKAGLKPREATSRRDMIPGRDKAFVFVSGGINFASSEDMAGGFYLRFDGNVSHKGHLQVLLTGGKLHCKVEFRDTPDTNGNNNLLSKLTLSSSSPNIDRQDSSSSDEPVPPSKVWSISNSTRKLKVMLLSSEWGSTKGGLSTINRELAIQLAKDDNMEVCMYLPAFSDGDKRVADKYRVRLLKAKEKPGYHPIDWLASVPSDHQMDVVIGHGIHLGRQVSHIRESHPECKWLQVVHTDPEELSMFKTYDGPTAEGAKKREAEVKLCQAADQVVAIGPKLADICSRSCGKEKVFVLTPGIFSGFASVNQATEERKVFQVLVFGRGDSEDFHIKGYDIAAQAVAALKDEEHAFKLVFVGAPNGKEEEVKKMLLEEGILPHQLIVRIEKEREQLVQEFYGTDLVIMPSRAEGFGLTALEALSAGLPVLVSRNSGFGQALEEVDFGSHFVVNSDKPIEWAEAIRGVRRKGRENRLSEARKLRKSYSKTYKWEEQCSRLIERIHELVADIRQPENEHENVEEEIRQLRTELNDTKGDLARVAEERDNLEERCQILAKQLEEAQVVGDSRKQSTTTFQDRATSPRKLEWKGIYVHRNDFDKNGVVYALKNKLDRMNPSQTRIIATRSSDEKGTARVVLENHLERGVVCATKARENSWWCVDLTENYALHLTHYTLRHGQEQRWSFLCNWRLEGSVDGCKWTMLKNHNNDRGLAETKSPSTYCTHTWAIDGNFNAFRYFRIFQTGKNSSGNLGIFLSGIELYGVLVEIDN
ncbi:uncharacterized protein LOC141882226 isoform X4 [Acropora palmata]|uniref:uncharacterized protein LOC141882226 isoform X4 n=1 Tax=Acropora palmata TaxID=6131 RepID=UPI003DA1A61D